MEGGHLGSLLVLVAAVGTQMDLFSSGYVFLAIHWRVMIHAREEFCEL